MPNTRTTERLSEERGASDSQHSEDAHEPSLLSDPREEFADDPLILRSPGANGFIRANSAFQAKVGFSDAELTQEPLLHWIDPDDVAHVQALLERGEGSCRAAHRTRSGDTIHLDLQIAHREQGAIILGRVAENPDPHNTENVKTENDDTCLVRDTLATIANIIEEQNPGYKCSILLVADGRFVFGAGPSLPDDYNAAIDGYAVGPTVGSCGTAIYWNVPVIVEDIQANPLWTPFSELAKNAGVGACWSHPFTATSGHVLGALAFYSPEPRKPTAEQLSRLRAAARMTGLAVERGRAEETLREKRKRELELEDQLRQAAKMEALGVLAGGVAHDFNNVLSAILANAEFAQELVEPDSNITEAAEIAEALEDVIIASKRAGDFCKQMLAYAGRGTLETTQLELGRLIPKLSSLVRAALPKKVSLEYALHDAQIFVEGDENQLLQVILNLITNAADAVGDNPGEIVVSTEIAHMSAAQLSRLAPDDDLPAGPYARLAVKDSGCGMDDQTAARIFDPFFTTKHTGHGLGLAAVKGIIRKHSGTINLESQLGAGTTFTMLLPIVDRSESKAPTPEEALPDVSRKRILVVDDEDAWRSILCRRLKHIGFTVIEAADGEEALTIFHDNPHAIDCVLLDLSMPKIDGEQVYRQLSQIREDLPVILMSGYTEQEVLNRFQGTQLSGFLQKPVAGKELIAAVHKALGSSDLAKSDAPNAKPRSSSMQMEFA